MSTDRQIRRRVAVVGACASGKSTLVTALQEAGYEARHVAQEHSYVPSMWQRISRPDVLIYLDVNLAVIHNRRPGLAFRAEDLDVQNKRLAHARQHCHLYLDTSDLEIAVVRERTLQFLQQKKSKN